MDRREAENAVEVERATKRFGAFRAVDDVSFRVAPGEFFALLGPSGCGKTTTLRMIAGFERPSSGRILLEGRDVSRVPPYRRSVNTVFQHYALFPHMSVWENVAFGPRSRRVPAKEAERRVGEVLDVVRLEALAGRKPAELSGGQQQRVALARALVNEPAVLLLDEPLGALDLKLRRSMQHELKRIQREVGIAFVYVTHDQEEALTMADRIAVMNGGRVEQVGAPEAIYDAPESVFVAGFIGVANLLPARIAGAGSGAGSGAGTLMVRPERVRVSGAPLAAGVSIPVTVTGTTFQGSIVRVVMRAGEDEIVAHVGRDVELEGIRPGASAFAGWSPDAARLLPACSGTEAGAGS